MPYRRGSSLLNLYAGCALLAVLAPVGAPAAPVLTLRGLVLVDDRADLKEGAALPSGGVDSRQAPEIARGRCSASPRLLHRSAYRPQAARWHPAIPAILFRSQPPAVRQRRRAAAGRRFWRGAGSRSRVEAGQAVSRRQRMVRCGPVYRCTAYPPRPADRQRAIGRRYRYDQRQSIPPCGGRGLARRGGWHHRPYHQDQGRAAFHLYRRRRQYRHPGNQPLSLECRLRLGAMPSGAATTSITVSPPARISTCCRNTS